jgi:hydroxypyruvate isomerase
LATLAGGTAGLATLGIPSISSAGAETSTARKGRIRHSVCRWCYGGIELEALCQAGKAMGLTSVELLGVKDFPVLQRHGLACAMVSGVPGGIGSGLNRLENHDRIVAFFETTAPIVAAQGFENIIVFSGNRGGLSDEQGIENCAQGIQRLVPICERHGVTAVMELLNSRVDHADYMCDHTEWGVRLCERVGSERFKLLYDIYHMQIMEGDVIATIRRHHRWIAHYHTGVPGRNEIDESQEHFYPAIMRAIVETGFKGFVGQEFIPKRDDALASLRQGVLICDV